ncbi:MAG: hypothetical protein Q9191_005243, partial [Dirinaria sp. TL-2023a]
MSSTSIDTAIFNPHEYSSSSPHFVTSAIPRSSPIQWTDKQISKLLTQAKNLYSTKQFVQAYTALQRLITRPHDKDQESPKTESAGSAPIAKAKCSLRIKVWCLYLSVLSEIIDSEPIDFRSAFGGGEYDSLKSKIVNGSVWEQVIQDGYEGDLGSVDGAVVQAV